MKPHIDIFRHISDKSIEYNNYITCREIIPTRNSHIDWEQVVGLAFDFSYQGINGCLTVVDFQFPRTIYFTMNNSDIVYEIGKVAFLNAGFRDVIKIHYYDYNVGDIVKNKEILGFTYNNKTIIYQYKCLNDGYIGNIQQSNINRNTGACPVCLNHKVIVGINDIPTTNPWMTPYFKGGYEEAMMYVASSNEYKELQCPHCGKLKKMRISTLYKTKSFACECSDKIPYPEKCMINLLSELKIDYHFQCGNKMLSWVTEKYHYDFYIPSLNMIIETNGKQHYEELSINSKWDSLEQIQERDLLKKNLALSNNIRYYIELDCRESNIQMFKESVMKSVLPRLFEFEKRDIDWDKIDLLSTRNIIKEVCLYKEEHPYLTPKEIADKFHINKGLLSSYYKQGEKFGWCTYNKEAIRWVSHFHRNTHYCINGYYFYNTEDITARSFDIFGEKICGGSVASYLRNSSNKKLFCNKYEIRTLTHKEYLVENKEYPSFVTKEIVFGLRQKYA